MEKTVINSASNRRMKDVVRLLSKAKERREQGLFVAEGVRMFLETPPARLEKVYVSESFYALEKNRKLLESREADFDIVSDRVFQSVSDTVTPQGILFLARIRSISEEQLFARRRREKQGYILGQEAADSQKKTAGRETEDGRKNSAGLETGDGQKKTVEQGNTDRQKKPEGRRALTYLLLDGIQDPGNLGTMVRTAEGAGVAAIISSRQTVDLYNPKVIRSTMGSVYRVPFLVSDDLKATIQRMKAEGICVYAAEGEKPAGETDTPDQMQESAPRSACMDGGVLPDEKEIPNRPHVRKCALSYDEADFTKDTAILIGNEGNGISPELSAAADRSIFIPMEGRLESLNASMAAGILMYEAARQKRKE